MNGLAWLLVLVTVSPLGAEEAGEHQRVGMQQQVDHRWETGLGFGLSPWGPTSWTMSLTPQLIYEYLGAWSVLVSVPYSWTSEAGPPYVKGKAGEANLGAAWRSNSGEPRWRIGAGVSRPLDPGREPWAWRAMGDCGASFIIDPILLGVSAQTNAILSPPLAGQPAFPWGGGVQLSLQDVLNDSFVSAFSIDARWSLGGPIPRWSVGVAWGIAWSGVPYSAIVSVSSASGESWGLSGSWRRTW